MDVVRGVHLDKRWSPILASGRIYPDITTYLVPGCGFGGSCFPKDVQALRAEGLHRGRKMSILDAVLQVNEKQPDEVISVLKRHFGSLASRRCLVLGLAFKPNTDDVRESASLRIIRGLIQEQAQVTAHDPIASDNFRSAIGDMAQQIAYVSDWRDHLGPAEIIVIATKWNEYRQLTDCDLVRKTVFDSRRLLPPASLKGTTYLSIGRRLQACAD